MDSNDRVKDMTESYHQVLHERAEEKLDAILEYVKDIPTMKADIRWLKADMREVKFDIELLKIDVDELKTDVSELKTGVGELRTGMQNAEGRLARIEMSLSPS